jgi:hypothetical protein
MNILVCTMYKYLRTGSVCIYICSLVHPKQPSVPSCLQFYQVTFPSYFMPPPPPPTPIHTDQRKILTTISLVNH